MESGVQKKKKKILCLHGFRTSGKFFQKQLSKWDPSIFHGFDLDFPDGIFPAGGKSDIEGIFPPPYFEWFQYNEDFTEYTNLEECISYLCDYISKNGPFDGLLGFSQGATLSALLTGYQAQGKVLKDHPPIKFFVSISGSKFRAPSICQVAYKDPIKVKSVHFIGAKDWLRLPSEELASAFDKPLIIRHPQGHTVPRLDKAVVEQLQAWASGLVQSGSSVHKEENGHLEKEKINMEEVGVKSIVTDKEENGHVEKEKINMEKVGVNSLVTELTETNDEMEQKVMIEESIKNKLQELIELNNLGTKDLITSPGHTL